MFRILSKWLQNIRKWLGRPKMSLMNSNCSNNEVSDKQKQATKIKTALGNEGLRKINVSGLSSEDNDDQDKLWTLFKDQLKIKVNFCIHRLQFSHFRQQNNKTFDEFVTRCRYKCSKCNLTDEELAERVIELVINSTPIEGFQKELLDKPKGYPISSLLEEGQKFEAIAAGFKTYTNCKMLKWMASLRKTEEIVV